MIRSIVSMMSPHSGHRYFRHRLPEIRGLESVQSALRLHLGQSIVPPFYPDAAGYDRLGRIIGFRLRLSRS